MLQNIEFNLEVPNKKPRKIRKYTRAKPVMRKNNGPRDPSWPDKALTEFFLPSRHPQVSEVELPEGNFINIKVD